MPVSTDQVDDTAWLGGRLRLLQPASGYRAGLDAALLAAAAPDGASMLEAGCGVGAALLAAAYLQPTMRCLGLEREPALAALAQENAARNGLADRIRVEAADVLAAGEGGFDVVLCNPPFDDGRLGRPPGPGKQHSHLTEHSLQLWVGRLADRLTGGGRLVMIHRADRLDELLRAMQGRLGGVQVRGLHAYDGRPAARVLVMGVKGSRAPLQLLPGLVLHEGGGRFTAMIESCLRGEARLAWV